MVGYIKIIMCSNILKDTAQFPNNYNFGEL